MTPSTGAGGAAAAVEEPAAGQGAKRAAPAPRRPKSADWRRREQEQRYLRHVQRTAGRPVASNPGAELARAGIAPGVEATKRLEALKRRAAAAGDPDAGERAKRLEGVVNRARRSVERLVDRVAGAHRAEGRSSASEAQTGPTETELKQDLYGGGGAPANRDALWRHPAGESPNHRVVSATLEDEPNYAARPARRDGRGGRMDDPRPASSRVEWVSDETPKRAGEPIGARPGRETVIAVTGTANYRNRTVLEGVLDGVLERCNGPMRMLVADGGGADRLAREWARTNGVPFEEYQTDWEGEAGRKAGTIRNETMLLEGRPNLVVAFPADSVSMQAKNMVKLAGEAGVPVEIAGHNGGTYPMPGPDAESYEPPATEDEAIAQQFRVSLEREAAQAAEQGRPPAGPDGPAVADAPGPPEDGLGFPWDEPRADRPDGPEAGGETAPRATPADARTAAGGPGAGEGPAGPDGAGPAEEAAPAGGTGGTDGGGRRGTAPAGPAPAAADPLAILTGTAPAPPPVRGVGLRSEGDFDFADDEFADDDQEPAGRGPADRAAAAGTHR